MTETKRPCCDSHVNEYHASDCELFCAIKIGVGDELHPTNEPGVFARNMKLTPATEFDCCAYGEHNGPVVHRVGECQEACSYVGHMVLDDEGNELCPQCHCTSSVARGCRNEWHVRPGKYARVKITNHGVVVYGRQNGKMRTYNALRRAEEACGPGVRVDPVWPVGRGVWQREDRQAFDRTFENEVRLHG